MNYLSKSRTAKLASAVVGFAMIASAIMPSLASADTASDLQAQINSLLATISALQSQLSATTGGSSVATGYTFNTNLTIGSTGADVMNLQKVLNMSADTRVASSGAGSPGMESSTFGPLTRSAVIKFQNKFGITPAAGYVGAITRGKLNSMGGTSTVPPVVTPGNPTGGALSVMAGSQPANSLAPKGASRVPFTNLTLMAGSADVTVNSITVERSGLAQDAAVAGVVLLDSSTGTQIGIAKTLNSNHQAMVGEPFVIRAGTSRMVTVAANMASSLTSYVGQVLSLNVVGVNTSASVSASFPIMGAQQTLNDTLTIGTATINTSSFDPNSNTSQPIGTTNYRFSGLKVTAGSAEDVTFKSIRWNQTGSVGSSDLANVVTVVNGTSYPTTVSTDGKYFTTVFPSGIVIAKGNSVDVYIQGDIVGSGASGRNSQFDIYKNTDIYLVGNTYGYGITAPVGTASLLANSGTPSGHATQVNTSTNPWFQGSTLNITAGSVTLIGKANEVAAQNISINVPNQVLGGFATNFSGEPVSVQQMKFLISTSSSASSVTSARTPGTAITNVTIVDENGAVVAGPIDAAIDTSTTYGGQTMSASSYAGLKFTDTITFKTGRHVYTIKGKIPTGWTNGTTVNIFTQPSTDWSNVTGQTTGSTVDLSGQSTAFTMNQVTVKGATLAVNIAAQPAAQNVVAGTQNFVLANYQLDASQSGEDIRLSALPLTITGTAADLTGCVLWDGTTQLNTGSRVVNTYTSGSAKTFSFDNSLTIPKGTVKTLSLTCNLGSSASGTYAVTADITPGDWSVTGITSGNTVTPTFGTGAGGTMTVQSGSFAVTIDSSTASYSTVAAGTSGVTIGTFKFRATNEDVNLNKIGLTLSTSTAADLGTVYLYQGSTLLGTVTFPQGAGATATSTLNSPLKLTRDTDVLITIKADLAAIGTGQSGTEGRLVKIDVTNAEGSGLSSGITLTVGGVTAGVNGVRMFKSYPTVSTDTLSSTGVSDGKLMRFKITAAPQGPVGIFSLDFSIATSSFATGGGVSAPKVMVYSDSSYSLPVSGSFGAATGQFGSTGLMTTNTGTFTASTTGSYVPLQIPAGTTYYFQVEATVASTQVGTSVTTILNGDSSYISSIHFPIGTVGPTVPMVSSTTGAIADTENDFIWSGNATSTAGVNSLDWANGFGISGLPSGGLSQTRSN